MMKKWNFVIVALMMTALLLTACGAEKVEVNDAMNGQSVSLKAGDQLVLSLESNPTTGFDWELLEYDETVLKLIGEPTFDSDSKLVGAGGIKTYTLEAQGSGKATIKLVYHRSWETDVPPEKEFDIVVEVK
jgi:inhibitor of cysteine peptidase